MIVEEIGVVALTTHFLFSALFQSADKNRPYSIVRG